MSLEFMEAFGQAALPPLTSMESIGFSLMSLIPGVRLVKVFISYKPKGKSDLISFINFLFKLFCNSGSQVFLTELINLKDHF